MEKHNLTQQKETFTNQKKCTSTQANHKKLAGFSRLLRHPEGLYSYFGAS